MKFRRCGVQSILMFALIFLQLLAMTGCKVQVFDLKPEATATSEFASTATVNVPAPLIPQNQTSPAFTSTPPIHIAPTQIQERVAVEIHDLVMVNGGSGWGIGQIPGGKGNLVVRTTDGGAQWTNVTPSDVMYQNSRRQQQASPYFLDSNQAWVIYWEEDQWTPTDGVTLWKTVDGGAQWEKIALPTEGYTLQYFRNVQISFINNQIGWIFASLGKSQDREYIGLYTTHDGGDHWNLLVSSDSVNLPSKGGKNGASFRNATDGWISGTNPKDEPGNLLWRTTDGGNTWNRQMLPAPAFEDIPDDLLSNNAYECSMTPPKFVDFQYQYAWSKLICQGGALTEPVGLLYWTYDSGNSWRVFKLPKAEGNLTFYGIYQGWFSQTTVEGSPTPYEILSTSNGGADWTSIAQTAWDSELQFITQAIGWGVVNYQGKMALVKSEDSGRSWIQIFPMVLP